MTSAHRSLTASVLFLGTFALVGATHCGGEAKGDGGAAAGRSQGGGQSTAGSSGTSHDSAGVGGSTTENSCGGSLSEPVGRPTAPACAVTSIEQPTPPAQACKTDSDCADAGMFARHCLNGKCGLDYCLADGDCAAGEACGCANQMRGDGFPNNNCVASGCRVDADCGESGVCSPDMSGPCGGLTGYRCHSAADTCHSNTDCCGSTPLCSYQSQLGHWACASVTVCNG